MPRAPRVEFPNAIYHVMTRGDGRRKLFHDRGHYERMTRGLKKEVTRSGWIVFSYCWMPNHIHLLVQTPETNLSRGMQHWLSGYANWYSKRNRHAVFLALQARRAETGQVVSALCRPCVGPPGLCC